MIAIIKAWWKEKTIHVELTKRLANWEMSLTQDRIFQNVRWDLQEKVKEAILAEIQYEIDKPLVKKIAQELLENYDYKSAVQNVMNERIQEYLRKT